MFARSAFRAAAPLKRNFRNYASQASTSGGMGALGYSAIALGAAGGGYYYYANVLGKAPQIPVTSGGNDPSARPSSQDSMRGATPPASADAKAFMGGEQGFVSLELEKVEDVNHNTKKFFFKFEDPNATSGLNITSAVITKFQPEGQKPVIRPYTPVSDEDQKGYLTFVVKKYKGGPMSEHLHDMKPGDKLDIKGPIPKYPWTANKHDHVALIAGGTGITPMWQLARAIFKNPEDKTKVTLVFGNLTEEDILLKHEFEALENEYPQRMRAFYVLDNPPEGWKQGSGHITKELLKHVLPGPEDKNAKVFVCGPPGLYKAVSGTKKSPQDQGELDGYLKELGYSKEQVYKF